MKILAGKLVGLLSNSEHFNVEEVRRRESGVSLDFERGTTLTAVKVPKYQLSVKG